MKHHLPLLAALPLVLFSAGCGTACGPVRTVPPQRLSLAAAAPASYAIRVQLKTGEPVETPVPPDGRVVFEVPVKSRQSVFICCGLPVYHYPPPDELRVIRVMRGSRTVRKLSAREIGQLPTDPEGYHILKICR